MLRGSKGKKRDAERSPVSELSDDLLVEIISRVPYKSTRCCKCVCQRWRDLVTHLDHRKKLPWSTLAGFFYQICKRTSNPQMDRGYQSLAGNWCPHIDPSLPFLPRCEGRDIIELLDCCNGLLLCQRSKQEDTYTTKMILDYVVCNPATEQWVSVPATEWSGKALNVRLGFDPAFSSHFHVFEFAPIGVVDAEYSGDTGHIKAVGIYSSKGRAWTRRSAWDCPIKILYTSSSSAFFNGVMYSISYDDMVVAVIDVEGNCRVIPTPTPHDVGVRSNVYLARGQLYLARYYDSQLSVWALEDCSSEDWILKHNVSQMQLFRKEYSSNVWMYNVIIHPEENVIFMQFSISYQSPHHSVNKLVSYEMDSRELRFIRDLEWGCVAPYLPYVPFFESLEDGH
ncbi:unnamed protein product [Alopecurus aequalis]